VTFGLEDSFKSVEDFGVHANGFSEGFGAERHNHEFLKVDFVVGMFAPVDDVGHRDRKDGRVDAAKIFVEWKTQIFGCGAGSRHGNTEHGVGAEFALVFSAIEFDERAVDINLFECIQATDFAGDGGVDILDGGQDTLALVALLVAVTKLDGFVFAGGGAGGNCSTTEGSIFEDYVDFDGRVAAGVKYFTSLDIFNDAHGILL